MKPQVTAWGFVVRLSPGPGNASGLVSTSAQPRPTLADGNRVGNGEQPWSFLRSLISDDERVIVHENVARVRATLDWIETAVDTGKVDVDGELARLLQSE